MKQFFTGMVAVFCAMTVLHAAEPVNVRKVVSCYTTGGNQGTGTINAGQSLSFKGEVKFSGTFGYMFAAVSVEPFKLTGKSLKFKLKAAYAPKDMFYVKAYNGKGQVVASFRTTADTGNGLILVCTPGSSSGGVEYFPKEAKGAADSDITMLRFYFARKGPAIPYDAVISDIQLIPREAKSSLTIIPMSEPGRIIVTRVDTCYASGGKGKYELSADGGLSYSAPAKHKKYGYLVSSVFVKPFSLEGKALSLDVKYDNFANDTFYVKALDVKGKVVASFYVRGDLTKWTNLVCVPGRNGKLVKFIAKDVKSPVSTPVVKLQFYCGRPGPAADYGVKIKNIQLIEAPALPTAAGFKDHGVGIKSAEVRSLLACVDKNGRKMVLCSPADEGRNYFLLTELDTGKTFQYSTGHHGSFFGGALTDDGKFVSGAGSNAYIFDINTRKLVNAGRAFAGSNLCVTLGYNNKAYLGYAPQSQLVELDLTTRKIRNLGRMDEREHYCSYLAVDKAGFVYAGIGTARANIVAIDPVSGKKSQLLPEKLRTRGTASVTAGDDGYVYVEYNSFAAKCMGGKIVEMGARCPKERPLKLVKYMYSIPAFDDGTAVKNYDLGRREMEIVENGISRKLKINYISGGLNITSMAPGPDEKVYFSSSHPHHLGSFDPADGKIVDLGYNPQVGGGNFCNMVAWQGKLYGCEYAGGRLWSYDPGRPAHYVSPKMPTFGVPFELLVKNSEAVNARWRELKKMQVLYASSGDDDNLLTLNLPVPAPGEWYLNLQFYNSGSYGVVTVDAGGKKIRYNAQNSRKGPGEMLNLGPFDIRDKSFKVTFNIRKNANRMSQQVFSLVGIELAKSTRKAAVITVDKLKNPDILGAWPNLITRPRTIAVNPLTGEVVIAGFANYGMVGGGFGIHDLKSGKNREISDWLPGESCIDMYFRKDGNLIGATSIDAPGGGHVKAKTASVFMLEWHSGKVVKHLPLPGTRDIYGIREFGNYIYAAASNNILYQIDKSTWKIVKKYQTPGRTANRNPLLITPDGSRMFLLQDKMICEIDRKSGDLQEVAEPPRPISVGGAIIGKNIYFVTRAKIESWDFSTVKK